MTSPKKYSLLPSVSSPIRNAFSTEKQESSSSSSITEVDFQKAVGNGCIIDNYIQLHNL